jgi:membrane-associated phospholipid phosphatase
LAASPTRAQDAPLTRYPEFRWSLDAPLLVVGAGLALTGGLLTLDRRDVPPEGLDPSEISWAVDRRIVGQTDEGADRASDWTRNAALAFPLVLALASPDDRWSGLGRRGFVYAQALLLSGGLTTLGKQAFGRPRPFTYLPESERPSNPNYDVEDERAFRSMPSGHTSTAWTAASVGITEHLLTRPDAGTLERTLVAFVGGGLAAATGGLRVESGQHFPSDVLAGTAIGIASGVTVPLLHAGGPLPSRRSWLEAAAGTLAGAAVGSLLASEL